MRILILCAVVLAMLPALTAQSVQPRQASQQTIAADGFHHPRADLITGGQPRPGDWRMLRGRKVTTVINLRTDAEMKGRKEATAVVAAGLDYQRLPVAGAADINIKNADDLWQRIEQAPGRVMVHCASGNRVGALLAIGAARHTNMTPQQALVFGRRAGLTGLEPRVREVLDLPSNPRQP